jgi:predicted O-linked N-acetylglucosamine transferase (SPINDLY family)
MATDNTQPVSPAVFRRAQFGLREDWVVFCSFNNYWKIDPATFNAWAGILRELPESCLWLPGGNAAAAANLRHAAERLGVSADRLVFAEKLKSKADHLGRLALADLALDTCGYNGHVSTFDALWAGVPVLTCLGTQFPGRASASMLIHAGLPELVCASLAEYQASALGLGRQPEVIAQLKARLKATRGECTLFDTRRFTSDLERVYTAMAAAHRLGRPPVRIEIHAE